MNRLSGRSVKQASATLLVLALLLAGGWQLGSGLYIHAKALLAQQLLERAWQQTRAADRPQSTAAGFRPWPWADTWPTARLRVAQLGIDQIVLAGDSGRTLAFGPGHNRSSASPGEPGMVIISGHRDTHFRFLQELRIGGRIELETRAGVVRYRVRQLQVVDSRRGGILSGGERNGVLLVTCYPFNSISPGGPLRYLVWAEQESMDAEGAVSMPTRQPRKRATIL